MQTSARRPLRRHFFGCILCFEKLLQWAPVFVLYDVWTCRFSPNELYSTVPYAFNVHIPVHYCVRSVQRSFSSVICAIFVHFTQIGKDRVAETESDRPGLKLRALITPVPRVKAFTCVFQKEDGGRRSMMGSSSKLLSYYHEDAKTMYEVFQRGLHITGECQPSTLAVISNDTDILLKCI